MTLGPALTVVQRRIGRALRARVAGQDAAARAQRIWGAPGPRWFTSTDPIWRVHADASMFPGGIASLLLQSLHPLAMAGVAGHSGYKSDPWGRLQRTSSYLATTTFGTIADAEAAIAAVRAIHERVRGTDPAGRPYRASDPDLLLWVHVAEIDSFLRAYQAFGARPLTAQEADTYVAQAGVAAARLGVLDPPRSVAALTGTLADYRPRLEATAAAREAARFLLLDPPLPLLARPGYATLAAGGVSLLPAWARGMLGLPMPEPVVQAVARPVGAFGTSAVRWALAGIGERRPSDGPARQPA
ncbi:MAG TPA: oxygenase MpaB family protein [Intrasporangium sp.]|uniref:oxygenase MpaB family protein n=1 Tax=Intrasporangium sp. TaxID=1925024 RepID=UPI002D7736A0|nr:oxygenase MpaB family protein [Intrasporangium sp.]HET7398171.1 oxygenase MpaB family protein [Intrasporangium sp.]